MIRVLIVDDHPIVRRGLMQILAETPDLVAGGEAVNATEALTKLRAEEWDAVVLDISMPGRSGLEVLKDIKSENNHVPVLVLSIHPEDQFAVRVLRAGASGYLTKDSAPAELVKAIRKVNSGGKYVSPQLAEKLAFELDGGPSQSPLDLLSDREFQVMRLIASGRTVTEIALDLSLSAKTISTYRARVLEKMNMKNNTDITRYALTHNLLG